MVGITIVTWNSLPYLKFCLNSLMKQTYKDCSIVIVDNASTDGTQEELNLWRSSLGSRCDIVKLIQNTTNRGFAAAHNQGIMWHKANSKWPIANTYILVLNPDVILTPTYIATMVEIMKREPKAAGITGQLLRYTLENKGQIPNPNNQTKAKFQIPITKQIKLTNIIDSEGLEMLPWRQVRERNAGQIAHGIEQIANSKLKNPHNHTPYAISYMPIWGISGACAFYRRCALEDVKKENNYFDEDFFCYKEDVDIAWRMRHKGWKFLYTPTASAFHHRGIGKEKPHAQRPHLINQWSYRNHFYVLLKNETLKHFVLHTPLIMGYEFAKCVYYLLVEPRTLLVVRDVYKHGKKMLKKRK